MNLQIDVDASSLIRALDRLGAAVDRHVQRAARETGDRVVAGAQARARRDTHAMANAITMDDAPGPLGGVRVFVGPHTRRGVLWHASGNFARWHEFGTRTMPAKPFLFAAARLEEGPHLRRVSAAVQDAIDDEGLGGPAL